MIYIPEVCGTCNGANKALELVYEIYEREQAKDNPKQIYIYKEILHNEDVIKELDELGIITTLNLKDVTSNDILIIRAHGEGKDTYDYLDKNNIEYYDATCPKVKKIHDEVYQKFNDGYEIFIIGDKLHPEVIGTNGWCQNKGVILDNEVSVVDIKNTNKKIFVTCQTTVNPDTFKRVLSLLENKFGKSNIEVYDATCKAVSNILESSKKLAQKCDLMFVIGGANSSNTENIRSSLALLTQTYKFSNLKEFINFVMCNDITSKMNIGITGGSSTPLKEVYNYKYILAFLIFYKEHLQVLKEGQVDINNNLIDDSDNVIVQDLIHHFQDLNQDGKYIRGILIALGYVLATNKDDHKYLNLSYAYEMFQTAILIHDDIIDNAKMRRGKETIPRRICKDYLNLSNDKIYFNDVLKLANSLAICSGDFGFYEANKLIVKSYHDNPNLTSVLEIFNDIVIKTIKGEIIDVALPFLGKYDLKKVEEEDILNIYHLKTSYYTIIGPFALGYALGGKQIDDKLFSILDKIGVSFQIKDDILGIFSESNKLGKSTTSDISEFKQTILYSHILSTPYKNEFLKIYGNRYISDSDDAKVKNLLIKSGSLDYANSYLEDLYSDTLVEIDEIDLDETSKDLLKGLLMYLNEREK